MTDKKIYTIDNLEMGPKMAYQCDCACPKATPASLQRKMKEEKVGVDGDIVVKMDIKKI